MNAFLQTRTGWVMGANESLSSNHTTLSRNQTLPLMYLSFLFWIIGDNLLATTNEASGCSEIKNHF